MPAADRRPRTDAGALRVVRWLAGAGALLAMVVVVSSATMRHLQSGLGCIDRAACYRPQAVNVPVRPGTGEPGSAPTASASANEDGTSLPRLVHRLSASGVTAALVGVLLVGWAARRMPPGVMASAWALALLVALLAMIGVRAVHLALPAVTLANLAGGMAVVALFVRLLAKAAPTTPTPDRLAASRAPWTAKAFAAALLLQVLLGGWVSAIFGGLACDGTLACPQALGGAWSSESVSLLARVEPPGDRSPEEASAIAGLNVVHRLLGLVVIGLGLATAFSLRRPPSGVGRRTERPRLAWVIVGLTLAQPLLGIVIATAGLPLLPVLAHNSLAALLLAAAVAAATDRSNS